MKRKIEKDIVKAEMPNIISSTKVDGGYFSETFLKYHEYYPIPTPSGEILYYKNYDDALNKLVELLIDDFEERTTGITAEQKKEEILLINNKLSYEIKNSNKSINNHRNKIRHLSIKANNEFIEFLNTQTSLDKMETNNDYFEVSKIKPGAHLIIIKKNQNLVLTALRQIFKDDYDKIVAKCRYKDKETKIKPNTAKKGKYPSEKKIFGGKDYKAVKQQIENIKDIIQKIAYK